MPIDFSYGDPATLFSIKRKLGEGSYGSVYYAIDNSDGAEVAVKVLEFDESTMNDLQKEINILKQCDNEYIVGYRGCWQKDGNIWIVMEYCVGGSVGDLMALSDSPIDNEHQIKAITKMMLLGLQYLHKDHKMHRDIKAANILICRDGTCKLADFGVSAELNATLAKRQTTVGTPYWMAPEIFIGAYDIMADIWSVGITILELAHGIPPLADMHPMKALMQIPKNEPPTLEQPYKYTPEFSQFLTLMLQKDPKNRVGCTQLLAHPFLQSITEAEAKRTIANLLHQWLPEIEQFRIEENEMNGFDPNNITAVAMSSEDNNNTFDGQDFAGYNNNYGYDNGTTVMHYADTMVVNNNGTMVVNNRPSYAMDTVVVSSSNLGSLRTNVNDSTMVVHHASLTPTNASAISKEKPTAPLPAAPTRTSMSTPHSVPSLKVPPPPPPFKHYQNTPNSAASTLVASSNSVEALTPAPVIPVLNTTRKPVVTNSTPAPSPSHATGASNAVTMMKQRFEARNTTAPGPSNRFPGHNSNTMPNNLTPFDPQSIPITLASGGTVEDALVELSSIHGNDIGALMKEIDKRKQHDLQLLEQYYATLRKSAMKK